MTIDLKKQLGKAIDAFLVKHSMSQSELAKECSVNAAYIIAIRSGKNTFAGTGGKLTDIADKWYRRIADYIDFAIEKSYWKVVNTDQLQSLLAYLTDAKANAKICVATGPTGCGKTMVLDILKRKYLTEVFTLKVGSSDNLGDLLNKICDTLKIYNAPRSKSSKIKAIMEALRTKCENGLEPMLCFDEAEYMKIPALCALKELYDVLNGWCALVLVGTPQLTDNIKKLKLKNKPGIPQLYRRIKFAIRNLPNIDKRFNEFLNGYDSTVKAWLRNNCDNYGELHDVLVPLHREAERLKQPITEELLRTIVG